MTQVLCPHAHVRFHPDCVLIPDTLPHSNLPHLESRTLSLPLSWSRKPAEADLNDPTFTPSRPTKLMVKIPSFSRRTRVHSPERDISIRGCLHSPSSPPRCIPFALDSVSEMPGEESPLSAIPASSSPPNSGTALASTTVPLRPCCQSCYSKMLLAQQENYVPRWSPGAKRKKERDERESTTCSHSAQQPSLDMLIKEGYQPWVFGSARVDEVEVRRGKGAPTKLEQEEDKADSTDGDSQGSSDMCTPSTTPESGPHRISTPSRAKHVPLISPSAEDRAFADMLPPVFSPTSPSPPPTSRPALISPTGHNRRQSFTERSSSMLRACLRGGSAVLKSVASAEGNVNIKLL